MTSLFLSVIISTYRRPRELHRCLLSLSNQSYRHFEVVVVDNADDDETQKVVGRFEEFRYVRENRLGLHHARHAGVRAALSDVLVFTDDDASFSRDWLACYAATFSEHASLAVAGGPVELVWERSPPQWLLESPELVSLFAYLTDEHQPEIDAGSTFYGVNMAIRKPALIDVGGFNPEAYGEQWLGDGETGLYYKLRNAGVKMSYLPNALVYHHIAAQRMTTTYVKRRLANQGAADAYSWLKRRPRGSQVTATMALFQLLAGAGSWLWARRLRPSSQQAVVARLGPSYRRAKGMYLLRMLYDRDLRELVAEDHWLGPDQQDGSPASADGPQMTVL